MPSSPSKTPGTFVKVERDPVVLEIDAAYVASCKLNGIKPANPEALRHYLFHLHVLEIRRLQDVEASVVAVQKNMLSILGTFDAFLDEIGAPPREEEEKGVVN